MSDFYDHCPRFRVRTAENGSIGNRHSLSRWVHSVNDELSVPEERYMFSRGNGCNDVGGDMHGQSVVDVRQTLSMKRACIISAPGLPNWGFNNFRFLITTESSPDHDQVMTESFIIES